MKRAGRINRVRPAAVFAVFIVAVVVIWQLIASYGPWPQWLLPAPGKVLENLATLIKGGELLPAIIISMRRLLFGFGLSLVVGTAIGLAVAKVKLIKETLGVIILGLQALPSICWVPLAILWFGLSESAILFIVVMGALLSISLSVETAVANINPQLVNSGKVLGASGWKLIVYVIFPAILPEYLNGIRQGWSFAWRSLMSGEMIFVTSGLGQLLMYGRELNDMAQVIAIMLAIMAIGLLFDKLLFNSVQNDVRRKWGLLKN